MVGRLSTAVDDDEALRVSSLLSTTTQGPKHTFTTETDATDGSRVQPIGEATGHNNNDIETRTKLNIITITNITSIVNIQNWYLITVIRMPRSFLITNKRYTSDDSTNAATKSNVTQAHYVYTYHEEINEVDNDYSIEDTASFEGKTKFLMC